MRPLAPLRTALQAAATTSRAILLQRDNVTLAACCHAGQYKLSTDAVAKAALTSTMLTSMVMDIPVV
jgi:hypothetical protein